MSEAQHRRGAGLDGGTFSLIVLIIPHRPTISYLVAYWILFGPKCLPSGFSFLKNRRAKASLITATLRVVALSSFEL